MNNPKAILISDIHYNINTLEIAGKSLRMAVEKANELKVNLVIAGDMHDTKANIRGECVIDIKKTLQKCIKPVYVLRGNHDSLNEKSQEHSLHFLPNNCYVIATPIQNNKDLYFIPYHHDAAELKKYLKTLPKNSTLIMHQGVMSTDPGHYIQDKSAISKEDLAGFTVFSGHYHVRQTFDLPENGKMSYLGNPYTLSFAESKDPEKGFHILNEDNTLTFVPTNFRKHISIAFNTTFILNGEVSEISNYRPGDLLWITISGKKGDFKKINKIFLKEKLGIEEDFKLTFEYLDSKIGAPESLKKAIGQPELLDKMIDSLEDIEKGQKERIKLLWKDFYEDIASRSL